MAWNEITLHEVSIHERCDGPRRSIEDRPAITAVKQESRMMTREEQFREPLERQDITDRAL